MNYAEASAIVRGDASWTRYVFRSAFDSNATVGAQRSGCGAWRKGDFEPGGRARECH